MQPYSVVRTFAHYCLITSKYLRKTLAIRNESVKTIFLEGDVN